MKYLSVFICFIAAVCSVPVEKVGEIQKQCAEKSEIDLQIIQDLATKKQLAPRSDKYYVYLECWAKAHKLVDESGNLSHDIVKNGLEEFYTEEKAKEILDYCWKTGGSLGDTIYLVFECLSKQISVKKQNKVE